MSDDFSKKISVIFKVNYWWLLVGILLTSAWWIIEALIFKHNATIIPRWKNYSFKDSFVVTMVGVFYMTVTPFSSGGHLFQTYYMKKQRFKISEALLVIMMNFIMYTWAMIIVAIIFYLLLNKTVSSTYSVFNYLFWAGIILNVVQNLILILGTSWDKFHKILINGYTKLLTFIKKFIKKLSVNEKIDSFEDNLERFRNANKFLSKNRSYLVKQISLNILRFMLFALIPIVISFALSMKYYSFGDFIDKSILLIGSSVFMQVLMTVVPTPGASGAAEAFLTVMWATIFNDPISAPIAMILWRLLTYYLHIIVSMPITFIYLFKYSKEELSNG